MDRFIEDFKSSGETHLERPERKDVASQPETPEELGRRNINRLTQQSRHFVSERKAELEKRKSRDQIAEADNLSEEPENFSAERGTEQNNHEDAKSFFGRLRDGLVLRRLRKEGFKDPEKALKFLKFVGENFDLSGTQRVFGKWTKRSGKRELKKEGHKIVHFIEDAQGDGKFTFEENVRSEKNLKLWKEILNNSLNDPLELIIKLGFGEKKPELFLLKSGSFQKLLNSPSVFKKIDIIRDLGIEVSPWQLSSIGECCEAIDAASFGPELVREIKKYTAFPGMRVPHYDFKLVVNIFKDESKRKLFDVAISNGLKPTELGYGWSDISRNLHNLTKAGIQEDIFEASRMGINIADVIKMGKRDLIDSGKDPAAIERIIRPTEDEKMIEFMKEIASLSADNSIPLDQVPKVQDLSKLPDFWAFFEAYRQLGVLKEEEVDGGGYDIRRISECMSGHVQKYVHEKSINNAHGYPMNTSLETIFSPAFDFVKEISQKHSFDLSHYKFNFLVEVYNDGRGNPAIALQEGEKLMHYLEKFGIDLERIYNINRRASRARKILSDPGFLKTLSDFSNYFNCDIRTEKEKEEGCFTNDARIEKLLAFNDHGNLRAWSLETLSRFCQKGKKLSLDKADLLSDLRDLVPQLNQDYISAFENDFDFFLNKEIISFLKNSSSETQSKIFSLVTDGLLDNKESHSFLYGNLAEIIEIPREKRKDYLQLISDLKKTGFSETLLGKILRYTSEKKDDANYREYLEKVKSDMDLLRTMSLATDNVPMRQVLIDGYLEADKERKSAQFLETARKSIETNRKMMAVTGAFSNLPHLESVNLLLRAEGLPEIIDISEESLALFQGFSEKYKIGNKGETIVKLLVARESKRIFDEDQDFSWKRLFDSMNNQLQKLQKIIEMNSFDQIPDGLRASIGMEYEITNGGAIQRGFENRNFVSFENNIHRISQYSKIGRGSDGLHEIATQPSDNPYLMLLEMKLLQDLEYIDFNFRPAESGGYYGAATGFHLSIGGEHGIKNGLNTYFLNNIISMSNWGGVNLEREVGSVGSIRDRCADSTNVFLLENLPPSVELRNFSIDRWEPFERTISTCFNAAVAIQAVERYTSNMGSYIIEYLKKDFPESADVLMDKLNRLGITKEANVELTAGNLIYLWLKLQVDFYKAIEDHNENFLTNETVGYLDQQTGEWADARENSGRNNQRYFEEGMKNFMRGDTSGRRYSTLDQFFEKELTINPESFFGSSSVRYANALTHIGNLFLTKFSDQYGAIEGGKKKKADPNILSFLTNTRQNGVKIESRKQDDVEKSLFDRKGEPSEGYYYMQGASEKMIIHQAQKLLLKFNQDMANLLKTRLSKENLGAEDLALAA